MSISNIKVLNIKWIRKKTNLIKICITRKISQLHKARQRVLDDLMTRHFSDDLIIKTSR